MIRIAQYQGLSTISKLIRWQTRSRWSHSAFLLDDDTVIEAWASPFPGKVRRVSSLSQQHTPGTIVEIFEYREPLLPENESAMRATLLNDIVIERPYDYLSICRFITRKPSQFRKAVFCSELVFLRSRDQGKCLLVDQAQPWEIAPRDIGRSPLLKKVDEIVTK